MQRCRLFLRSTESLIPHRHPFWMAELAPHDFSREVRFISCLYGSAPLPYIDNVIIEKGSNSMSIEKMRYTREKSIDMNSQDYYYFDL